jgi:hypothetical protein
MKKLAVDGAPTKSFGAKIDSIRRVKIWWEHILSMQKMILITLPAAIYCWAARQSGGC